MKPSVLYRVAAGLLVLFAAGHQFGFRTVDPAWNADNVVEAMRSTRFAVQGFTRDYWAFFSGFGFFVTVFLLFSAVIAWEAGRLSAVARRPLSPMLWAFAVCYLAIAIMTWMYFFVAPGVFATMIAVCLVLAVMNVNKERLA